MEVASCTANASPRRMDFFMVRTKMNMIFNFCASLDQCPRFEKTKNSLTKLSVVFLVKRVVGSLSKIFLLSDPGTGTSTVWYIEPQLLNLKGSAAWSYASTHVHTAYRILGLVSLLL